MLVREYPCCAARTNFSVETSSSIKYVIVMPSISNWLPTERSHYLKVLNLACPWASNVTESLVPIHSNLVDEETPLDTIE